MIVTVRVVFAQISQLSSSYWEWDWVTSREMPAVKVARDHPHQMDSNVFSVAIHVCIYGTKIEPFVLAIFKFRHKISSLVQMKYVNLNWLHLCTRRSIKYLMQIWCTRFLRKVTHTTIAPYDIWQGAGGEVTRVFSQISQLSSSYWEWDYCTVWYLTVQTSIHFTE